MDIMFASKFMTLSEGSYSPAIFTTGPYKGKCLYCCPAFPRPFPGGYTTHFNTDDMYGSYSGFLNLNNVVHTSVSGCVVASPAANALVLQPSINNVLGPVYLLNNYVYCTEFTSGDYYLRRSFFGNYNNTKEGNWWYMVFLKVLSPGQYFTGTGEMDLEGSSQYTGFIRVRLFDYEFVSSSSARYRILTRYTQYRTSAYDYQAVYNAVYASMRLELNAVAWKTENISTLNEKYFITGYSGSQVPKLPTKFDVDVLFPIHDRNPNWADLARNAYNNASYFSGNGLAFLKDCSAMGASAIQTGNLITSLITRKTPLVVIAKLFLAFHYGWKLFISDSKALRASFKAFNSLNSRHQKCSSGTSYEVNNAHYTAYYHCYYERYGQLESLLDQFVSFTDLELSLENIWDLIPYSFVVDWFFNIGDILSSMHSYYTMTQEHRVTCTGRSIRCIRNVSTAQLGLTGLVGVPRVKYYSRQYTSDVITPSFLLTTKPKPLDHIVEGGALIISKR